MRVAERVLNVEKTLGGRSFDMKIAPEAVVHIMGVLTDLYANPTLAVIREYCTNALDAHVEAGITRPIEVTLPSQLSQFFKVRDYGEGLDEKDIEEIYSQYGISTKRDSDDVVGMLGLGCKSALAYTDQFTLTGIKNGVKTIVSVSYKEDGSGEMTVVDHFQTDEPSGVEVVVPTERNNGFEEEANDFFKFWDEGTVLVNGKAPKRVDGIWITDDLLLTRDTSSSHVVMGNVPYPMPSDFEVRDWRNGYALVAFVDIGTVHFTPAREALNLDNHTRKALQDLKMRFNRERDVALQRRIEEAKKPWDAIVAASEARILGLAKKPQWKGQDIPDSAQVKRPDLINKKDGDKPLITVDAVKRWRVKGWSSEWSFSSTLFKNTVWVTGYDSDSFSPFKRQKMEKWLENKKIETSLVRGRRNEPLGTEAAHVVFCDKVPKNVKSWIDPTTVYKWEEIKAIKIEREAQPKRSDGRPTGSYKGYVAGKYQDVIEAGDIDTSKGLFFTTAKYGDYKELWVLQPEATLIEMGQNRVAKFQRDFPMAEQVEAHLSNQANDWWENLSEDDKNWLGVIVSSHYNDLKSLSMDKLNDTDLTKLVELAKEDRKDTRAKYQLFYNRLFRYGIKRLPTFENPFEKYPLLTNAFRYDKMDGEFAEHVYLYMNAVDQSAGQEKS